MRTDLLTVAFAMEKKIESMRCLIHL